MESRIPELSQLIEQHLSECTTKVDFSEVGQVISVGDGIARVYGLEKVQSVELVEFPGGVRGMVLNLEVESVGVVIFGTDGEIREGDVVRRTNTITQVPTGKGLLGRVVNALGEPIDGKGPLQDVVPSRTELKAPGVMARRAVTQPMRTGIKAIDSLIPIGRGPVLRIIVRSNATQTYKRTTPCQR